MKIGIYGITNPRVIIDFIVNDKNFFTRYLKIIFSMASNGIYNTLLIYYSHLVL